MGDGWKAQDDEVADKLGWMQLMDSDLLVAAAKGELDLNEVARWPLTPPSAVRHVRRPQRSAALRWQPAGANHVRCPLESDIRS